MTADSSEETTGIRGDRALYRVASTEKRFEGVVHSLLLVLTAFLFAGVLVGLADTMLQGVGLSEESAPAISEVVLTGTNFLGLLVVSALYLAWRSEWSLVGVQRPTLRDLGVMVGGAITLISIILALEFVLSQFGLQPDENVAVVTGRDHPELYLYYIPIVLLLNAPAEELLFRGIVQGLFRRAYGIVPGILAASLLFGLIHSIALVGEGSAAAYIAIAIASGLILGAVYEYTENILVPIIVHAIWNILVYLSLYVETVGLF